MRLRLGLVLALALGLAPLQAHAQRPAPQPATRAQVAESLAKRISGLDPRFAKAAGLTFDSAFLVRGADFDGDGAEEVVDVWAHVEENETTGDFTETLRLDARRGTDGKLLWSKTVGSGSYVFPLFAKVGTGGMGVVVVSYGGTFAWTQAGGGGVESTTVTTFDGKGTQVWTQAFQGGGGYTDAGGGVSTYFEGVLNANPGGGDEVLVSNAPYGYAYDPLSLTGPAMNTLTPVVLDGTNGRPRPLTPVVTTSPLIFATPMPDLDKDGRDDVVVAGGVGPLTTVVAERSSDGTLLWANRDVPGARAFYPRSVGDATGDGIADVAVSASEFSAGPVVEYQGAQVSLLDGAKGTRLWTKAGGAAFALGNADRKGGADVGVGDWLDEDDGTMGFRVAAYDTAGKTLWTVQRSLSFKGFDSFMASGSFGEIGDTNGDGANEIGYALRLMGSDAKRADEGTIDGRTGKARRDPVSGMYSTRLAFDGTGSDGYRVDTKKKNVLHVTAYSGDGTGKLWDVTIPVKGIASGNGSALFAGRDRCADLAVAVNGESSTTTYVLSGATGRPLWALSRGENDAKGTVTHPSARSAKAFSRAAC